MDETIFVPHLIIRPPRENAPSFVKGRMSINAENAQALAEFFHAHAKANGWVDMDVCESRDGDKWYAKVNKYTLKPEEPKDDINAEDAPF